MNVMTQRLTWMEWVWRLFGAGPTAHEIDADLALSEPPHTTELLMSDTKAPELQLAPPPGTPDSPRKISIFVVSDDEWWAGETLQQVTDLARESWGIRDPEEWKQMFGEGRELSEHELDALQFNYDEDDPKKRHSFRTELEMRLADPKQHFPQFFAGLDR